jgi:hypothetical protein
VLRNRSTGLIGAVFNQGFALLKDSIRRRRRETQRARGFALKLVGMLTAYAQACNSLIDSNDYEQEHGALGSYELPELAPYPSGPKPGTKSPLQSYLLRCASAIRPAA